MSRLLHIAAPWLIALTLTACAHSPSPDLAGQAPAPPVILISIDGFRADYLARGFTPTLSRLATQGVHGAIRPSFPSKTFPNHYTLVTGLRPDRHGIVDNNMIDPEIPETTFALSNKAVVRDARWWNDGTPIWVSAERAGIGSAVLFWPGSEAPIQGVRPSAWRPYDQSISASARVDQVLAWVDAPAGERPGLIALYFDEVDTAGHHYGPASGEVARAAAVTDAAIGRLVEGLETRGLPANLVIVADHGMAEVAAERAIYLEDLVSADLGRPLALGAFMTYYPAQGREAQAEAALLAEHEHMTCWRKAEIPARYHFGTHRRAPPIFCLPQTGWEITTRARVGKTPLRAGNHGFDPYSPEMAAIFIGHGPAFARGRRTPLTDNVDVYPLLAKLLGVALEPNDGGPTLAEAALAH
ncbi:MAG TPA: ectonucleotide pyrophosphatase/phosphodiesterase [Phenylobacterium sp.]|nr:ectonucleotide pyrophosphatase/phosphodiesterase [Phenylobacterium sp.]